VEVQTHCGRCVSMGASNARLSVFYLFLINCPFHQTHFWRARSASFWLRFWLVGRQASAASDVSPLEKKCVLKNMLMLDKMGASQSTRIETYDQNGVTSDPIPLYVNAVAEMNGRGINAGLYEGQRVCLPNVAPTPYGGNYQVAPQYTSTTHKPGY
jgi:hypothetical protein